MDIHKPKPWHGLREFLKEYAIIVVGVLTALVLEQSVEWLHWRHEVEAERVSLLDDAKYALQAIRFRQKLEPCIDTRLQEVHALIERHSKHQPLGLIGPMGQHIRAGFTTNNWDVAVSGQALAHMKDAERIDFSGAFSQFKEWSEGASKERDIWSRLLSLSEPDLLTEQGWTNVTEAYWAAVQANFDAKHFASFVLERDSLGLPDDGASKPTGAYAQAVTDMCRRFVAP